MYVDCNQKSLINKVDGALGMLNPLPFLFKKKLTPATKSQRNKHYTIPDIWEAQAYCIHSVHVRCLHAVCAVCALSARRLHESAKIYMKST